MLHNQNLMLNVLPLDLERKEMEFSFYKENPDKEDYLPLWGEELPEGFKEEETLYTNFSAEKDADFTITVALKESPNFARHYLNHLVFNFFKGKAHFRDRNFIWDTVLYFQSKDKSPREDFVTFDRYVIRPSVQKVTEGFELTVMYKGRMYVWKKPFFEYPGHSEDISRVVYNRKVYRFDRFNSIHPNANKNEVFPVLNRFVGRSVSLPPKQYHNRNENRLKKHTDHILAFYKECVQTSEFGKVFKPDPTGFLNPSKSITGCIPENASLLQFGNGNTEKDPMSGLKLYGPHQAPIVSHIELFIIVHRDRARSIGLPLYNALKDGLGPFPGIRSFMHIPVNVIDSRITFVNDDDPLPEIKAKLKDYNFDPNKQYGAIYLSPIKKDDPDPKRHRVYYKLKEELLKYKVTSQVISEDSVTDISFKYYLANIATALLAKIGGIPWTLEQQDREELIIGVGAYRPSDLEETYLGSAFCFSNSGNFKGFESFTSNDLVKLGGSFQNAIQNFREEHADIERVVLHFYKKLSRKEEAILREALDELKLDIPLIICTIYTSGARDMVLTDLAHKGNLPVSGTWIKSGENEYLLCNNNRFGRATEKVKAFPFPLKVQIEQPSELNTDKELEQDDIEELLRQIYQFSRLNWKSVTIKDIPVTIAYPEMVAEKFPYFEGDTIPSFGKKNFWFL